MRKFTAQALGLVIGTLIFGAIAWFAPEDLIKLFDLNLAGLKWAGTQLPEHWGARTEFAVRFVGFDRIFAWGETVGLTKLITHALLWKPKRKAAQLPRRR